MKRDSVSQIKEEFTKDNVEFNDENFYKWLFSNPNTKNVKP